MADTLLSLEALFQESWFVMLLTIWVLPWKGIALWKAANKKQTIWFILFLVVNTLGIVEILYIFWFSKIKSKAKTETPSNQ